MAKKDLRPVQLEKLWMEAKIDNSDVLDHNELQWNPALAESLVTRIFFYYCGVFCYFAGSILKK